ncbi:META domain-containing protein [Methylomonas sp. MO1]|uniref:META domain-containing protein n=1 Tax=Methylomonas sp. MO1 TaxID=3073619 RepID=UPI0028A4AF86|nr:META domain-containing protein [Methylomonas sp. MO1]MDT4290358.1 META domain-containing protein [Methylomonas sp. MO1]
MFKKFRLPQRCLPVLPLLWISACAVVDGDASVGREAQADAAIKDRVWQLSRLDADAGDESFTVGASDRYTLTLLADGSYRVKADCNRMQGAYRLESERRIALSPGAATLAECGPDSHYAQYIRQLSEVRQFEVMKNTEQLKLVTDKGRLIFDHAEHEAP